MLQGKAWSESLQGREKPLDAAMKCYSVGAGFGSAANAGVRYLAATG